MPVTARAAEIGSLRAAIHTTGVVTAAQDGEFRVVASEPSRVLEIAKNEGEAVSSGDVLVRFDAGIATAVVQRQRAELANAQAMAENARIAHNRTREFIERGMVARQEIDRADRELADAQATVARAQVALTAAEALAARAIVRAPFAGVVASKLKNPGDLVSSTDTVLRVIDPRRLEVTATVSSADAPRVVPGASAHLTGGGATRVRLVVAGRTGMAEGQRDMIAVRLTFLEPPAVAVDSAVEIDIDAEERTDVVFVPVEALVRSPRETVVFVAADNVAERRPVMVGVETEEQAEITSGVKAGELVITRGQDGLEDGAAISVDLGR